MTNTNIWKAYLKTALWAGLLGATGQALCLPISGIGVLVLAVSVLKITLASRANLKPTDLKPTAPATEIRKPSRVHSVGV